MHIIVNNQLIVLPTAHLRSPHTAHRIMNKLPPLTATKPADPTDPPSQSDIEEDIASISEHISFDDSARSDAMEVVAGATAAAVAAKKRQLFSFGVADDDERANEDDDDLDDLDAPMFRMDDALLDGDRIAEHFRVEAEEPAPVVIAPPPASSRPQTKTTPPPKTPAPKDLSPFQEDVILLNNDKISLASLTQKTQQLPPLQLPPLQLRSLPQLPPLKQPAQLLSPAAPIVADDAPSSANTTNQNTTNDVSDIAADADGDGTTELSPAAALQEDDGQMGSSIEADHSIDEILVSNASISVDLVPKVRVVATERGRDEAKAAVPAEVRLNDTLDDISLGSVDSEANPAVDMHDSSLVERLLADSNEEDVLNTAEPQQAATDHVDAAELDVDSLDPVSDGVLELKQRILSAQEAVVANDQRAPAAAIENVEIGEEQVGTPVLAGTSFEIKPMQRIDAASEGLDDISEVTEPSADHQHCSPPNFRIPDTKQLLQTGAALRNIIQSQDSETNAHSFDSVISLNMLDAYEQRIRDLEATVVTKDVCLGALQLQLQRRESLKEAATAATALDSCSLQTTGSTEYRTYPEELVGALSGRPEFAAGILEREHLIEQLTDALQQSMLSRDQLQSQADRVQAEVVQLRRQLAESIGAAVRRPAWMVRSDSAAGAAGAGGGQRISEISIDLVSDGDAEEQVLQIVQTTVDDAAKRRTGCQSMVEFEQSLGDTERAQFAAMREKFELYMRDEIATMRENCTHELRAVSECLAAERSDKETELNRLRQLLANTKGGSPEICDLRRELDAIHGREMEELRTYFERKCADLEKQYSEEIFSQHSRRHSNDSSSAASEDGSVSDQEPLPDDQQRQRTSATPAGSKQGTPRRNRTKPDIWSSPTHRKITPTSIDGGGVGGSPRTRGGVQVAGGHGDDEQDPEPTVQEVESFYRDKIAEINRQHEEAMRMLKFRLKRFECRSSDDEYMPKPTEPTSLHRDPDADQADDADNDDDEDDVTSLKEIVATGVNDSQVITQIVGEYELRLKEQLALAKEDMVAALEEQIQALLSENSTDDSHWPPELILLREKFTAKSQLEVAQLQIAHRDEMDRLRCDFDKQLSRKQRRHTTFDENRGADLDQVVLERDNLRELCHTFRWLLSELAKCVSVCEADLNKTLVAELHKHGIDARLRGPATADALDECDDETPAAADRSLQLHDDSLGSSGSADMSTTALPPALRLVPDVSGILTVIEDPSLLDFVEQQSKESGFDLNDCVDRLKAEAMQLLELSENLFRRKCARDQLQQQQQKQRPASEKGDSCEEEDGLKSKGRGKHRWLRHNNSLNESILCGNVLVAGVTAQKERLSLPGSLRFGDGEESSRSIGSVSELTSQLNDLRNRLLVSETDRAQLRAQLDDAQKKHDELSEILGLAKEHMEQLERQKEEISEGFGISQLKSPSHAPFDVSRTSYTDLQNTARSILNVSPDRIDGPVLLQQIEDFCAKLDRFVEEEKHNKTDLQEQIDAAYKQKKTSSKLLEQQAIEWQQERDEFTEEIEKLKAKLRDREKECVAYGHVVKEVEQMEQQIKEMTLSIVSYEDKKHQLELDLKEHIDKIFLLREVIKNLETQIDAKTASESALLDQLRKTEAYATSQSQANDSLHDEVEELKQEYVVGYGGKIAQLEEQLRTVRPTNEHQLLMEQCAGQLRQIERILERKTKALESLHSDICSASCSSQSEDVSKGGGYGDGALDSNANSPLVTPRSMVNFAPGDDVQRILEKLQRHSRAEEAAVKRIRDLEMQMATLRTSYDELQSDRDVLQEKMSEQILRISSLQQRLDEQRHRAEEIHRQGTSDLSLKVYDLQAQLTSAQDLLAARDKQIVTLRSHLEQSKQIIDRQETDLAVGAEKTAAAKLEADLKARDEEIARLKERMRGEMISKMALPDLMETMLSEKSEEIDRLKEELAARKGELQAYLDLHLSDETMAELRLQQMQRQPQSQAGGDSKLGGTTTVSDIVSMSSSDFGEEADICRRDVGQQPAVIASNFFSMSERKAPAAFGLVSAEPSPIEAPVSQQTTAGAMPKPRQINFSLTELKHSVNTATSAVSDDPPSIVPVLQREIGELQQRLDSALSDSGELKQRLEAVQSEKGVLSGELNRHRDAASSLKLELAAKSQAMSNLMDERSALQAELAEIRAALEVAQQRSGGEQLGADAAELRELRKQFEANRAESEELFRKIQTLSAQNEQLQSQVSTLGDQLTKREKDALNCARNEAMLKERIATLQVDCDRNAAEAELTESLRNELEATKTDLYERMIDYEKGQLDIAELRDQLTASGHPHCEDDAQRPFDDNEIAASVAKELNYSAHLDSSILKAIESDELTSDDRESGRRHVSLSPKSAQIHRLQQQAQQLHQQLAEERRQAGSAQQQDAAVIDAMRQRLEAAVDAEARLQQQLDAERSNVDRLATQVLVHQRSSLTRENSMLSLKSPADSPRRSPRTSDADAEQVSRLQSEIKLLTAQSEREKERLMDTERQLEREKMRFEKELADRKDYGERMKRELDRVLQEKAMLGQELDATVERVALSTHEIAALEARIGALQEAETRRATRRGQERNDATQTAADVQELRLRLAMAERERDALAEKCTVLRGDVERGSQREAQLTEALVREHSGDGLVPQQFLQKLASIAENTKEYRQMAQTLQFLTEERQALQQRVDDLELRSRAFNRDELEKRANHLFGKYLRVESFRKSLVHQKRYLLIMLQTYQENEAKALALINKARPQHQQQRPKKRPSFRSAVIVVIAIERMKFVVRRWQTGKRVGSEAIFSHQLPRRSASATTNIWAHVAPAAMGTGQSPPCRDRPPYHPHSGGAALHRSGSAQSMQQLRALQAPALIAECSERLEAQHQAASATSVPATATTPRRQWSRTES